MEYYSSNGFLGLFKGDFEKYILSLDGFAYCAMYNTEETEYSNYNRIKRKNI